MKAKGLMIAGLGVLLTVSAFAQRAGFGGQFPAGPPPAGTTDQRPTPPDPLVAAQTALGLTAAQVESIRALMQAQGAAGQPIMEEIRAKQNALRTLQQSGTASATDLGNALAAVQAAEAKLKAVHDKYLSDFSNLLTTDQKKIVADTIAAASRIGALAGVGLVEGGPGGPGGRGGRGGPGPGGPRGPGR